MSVAHIIPNLEVALPYGLCYRDFDDAHSGKSSGA